MYANKIAEKVFYEFDHILNDLSHSINFESHFDVSKETTSEYD